MNFRNMHLVTSAPNKDAWPESNLPEIALAGRSNVGKSSLINTLAENKRMAYVGNTPGKTRLLNFFDVDQKMMLVDVPGYGYANASQKMLIQFGEMMEDYFSERENVKGIIILIDSRHKPTEDDLGMLEYARYYEFPVLIVATKSDKLSKTELSKNLKTIAECCDVDLSSIIPFSSETKVGKEALIEAIESLISED